MIKNSDFSLGTYRTQATAALGANVLFYSAIRRTFSLPSEPPSPPAPLPRCGRGVVVASVSSVSLTDAGAGSLQRRELPRFRSPWRSGRERGERCGGIIPPSAPALRERKGVGGKMRATRRARQHWPCNRCPPVPARRGAAYGTRHRSSDHDSNVPSVRSPFIARHPRRHHTRSATIRDSALHGWRHTYWRPRLVTDRALSSAV